MSVIWSDPESNPNKPQVIQFRLSDTDFHQLQQTLNKNQQTLEDWWRQQISDAVQG